MTPRPNNPYNEWDPDGRSAVSQGWELSAEVQHLRRLALRSLIRGVNRALRVLNRVLP